MVAFLSREWIDALDRAAAASPALGALGSAGRLVVEQHVTGVDGGDVAYVVSCEDGEVHVRPGPADDPTIRFSQDLATAVGIAGGTLSAQRAFMTGRLRVGGDLSALVANGEVFAAIGDVFADVRAQTDMPAVDGTDA